MGLAVSTALLLGGCVNELANVPTPEGEQTQLPTDTPYVEGELIVKFTPEVIF